MQESFHLKVTMRRRGATMRASIALVLLLVFSACAFAQTTEERLQDLEKSIKREEQPIQ